MDPAGVPVADLARLLRLSEEAIRRHIDQGAPTNADGTVNFIHYAAWLNQRLAGRTHGD
ncbi:MAG: hypothetical protein IT442_13560 [Phycisphaeraceae bacterium]|nr:hypothetical protein [Phycisphaeraceae bacterium]